jgi:hypothetical protein
VAWRKHGVALNGETAYGNENGVMKISAAAASASAQRGIEEINGETAWRWRKRRRRKSGSVVAAWRKSPA